RNDTTRPVRGRRGRVLGRRGGVERSLAGSPSAMQTAWWLLRGKDLGGRNRWTTITSKQLRRHNFSAHQRCNLDARDKDVTPATRPPGAAGRGGDGAEQVGPRPGSEGRCPSLSKPAPSGRRTN